MTRTVLILLIGVLSSIGTSSAQEPIRFQGRWFSGVCASQIHGDGVSGFNKFGLTAGPLLVLSSKDKIWEWGLLYTQKGSRKVPNPKAGDYSTWRYRFTYVDVPLVRVWKPEPWWWFGLGVQPSLLLRAEEDFYSVGYSDLTTPSLRNVDVGLLAVLGLEYTDHLALEARLSQSALPISERPEAPVMRWDNFLMNMAIQAGVKILFGSN